MKSLKEQLTINEDRFGYTWQNAAICAFVALINEGKEDIAKGIVGKWFDEDGAIRGITSFLYQMGIKEMGENMGGKTPGEIIEGIKQLKMSTKYSLSK